MSEKNRNPVDVLADDFARRLKAGEEPTIDEYVTRYPKHAATIRAMFPSIRLMERVGHQERTEATFDRRTQSLTKKQEPLGDFRIIREVGRGGMGIVYEAEQQSLKRRVALKVLAPHVADSPAQLKRFRREAKAAARLHHTNIVPVYGVGEADGLHFFAMQFIEGVTLQQKLANEALDQSTVRRNGVSGQSLPLQDVPTTIEPASSSDSVGSDSFTVEPTAPSASRVFSPGSFHESARIIRDVAAALSYAHEHGVHHRDIKPGNLLLDEQGTVWVTDFGLAKHESDDAATRTGDIVGTLRYMAPEQFNGTTDGRSDICSLGLTLFEMLTHEPAYSEVRAAALMKVKTQEPPPSPRSINPAVPADLETITLKASAMDPSDRYQTAREMAEDLDRFLHDLPILARPVTPVERLWRWTRRNPLIASLSAGVFLLLVATAAVFAFGNYRTGKALELAREEGERATQEWERAEANLLAARVESARAEKNFQMAVDAFEQIMANVSSRGSALSLAVEVDGEELAPPATVVTAADAELLQTLLEFFDLFASENRADLSDKTADALARVGRIQQRLGLADDAARSFAESLQVYAELEQNSDDPALRLNQAAMHRELMLLAAQQDDMYSALQHYREGRSLLDGASGAEARFELAMTLSAMSGVPGESVKRTVEVAGGRGPGPGGRPPGGRGLRGPRGSGSRSGGGFGGRMGLFRPRGGPPADRMQRGRQVMEEARRAATEAVAILSALSAEDPSNRTYRLELARAHRRSIDAFRIGGSRDEAAQALAAAITQLQWLVDDSPNSPVYRYELATTLCVRLSGNRIEHAVRVSRAVSLARELTRDYPGIPEYRALLASALTQRNNLKRGTAESREGWEEIVSIYRELHRQFPDTFAYRLSLVVALRNLAGAEERENPMAARQTIKEAVKLLKSESDAEELGRDQQRIVDVLLRQLREYDRRFSEPSGL